MDIDWAEISKNLGTRIANTILEAEQWKNVADTLFKENERLKVEKSSLETKLEAYETDSEEPTNG